ncbi:MAG: hypothetical protein EOP84_05135, partial [Verrucomicrobiaceae bacterium]
MTNLFLGAAAFTILSLPLSAAQRSGGSYMISADIFDVGGGPAASAAYMQSASIGSLAGTQSSTSYSNISGFLDPG